MCKLVHVAKGIVIHMTNYDKWLITASNAEVQETICDKITEFTGKEPDYGSFNINDQHIGKIKDIIKSVSKDFPDETVFIDLTIDFGDHTKTYEIETINGKFKQMSKVIRVCL